MSRVDTVMTPPMAALCVRLGYRFQNPTLLQTALTHRSHSLPHNERLEFLGDGLLNCVIAAMLYARFPSQDEGSLSRMRAGLVRQDALHQIALALQLGEAIRLGDGEMKSGGHTRPSILADTVEAVLGAVFLDAGFAAVEQVILHLYQPLILALSPGGVNKDPKTRLQEWLQGRKKALPRYELQSTEGAAHVQRFEVVCHIESLGLRTLGYGHSRRAAEQDAATQALKEIQP